MIQKTSLEAFDILKPNLGDMQRTIYELLKVYPDCSNLDISLLAHKPINCITPRVFELRNMGLVICSGYKQDPFTNKKVMTWQTV